MSLITNEKGGIKDDCIITKVEDNRFFVVVNGACKEKDLAHMNEIKNSSKFDRKDVSIKVIDDHSLIAVQGPKAMVLMQDILGISLVDMDFMTS